PPAGDRLPRTPPSCLPAGGTAALARCTVGRAAVGPASRAVRPVARQSGEPQKGPAAHRAFSVVGNLVFGTIWQPSPGVPTSALPGHPLSRFTCRLLGPPVDAGGLPPGRCHPGTGARTRAAEGAPASGSAVGQGDVGGAVWPGVSLLPLWSGFRPEGLGLRAQSGRPADATRQYTGFPGPCQGVP